MQSEFSPPNKVWQRLGWLAVYAIAMGLLEGICVIYLRRLLPTDSTNPAQWSDRAHVETIREVCTIVMLAAVAWLAGINGRSRLACFFFAFGWWDILYYVALKWFGHWPESLLTWDCLFLIPKPWYGPVLAPVLISVYFVVACGFLHVREIRSTPLRLSAASVLLQIAAFLLWYWSFVKDADAIAANGYQGAVYSWPLFIAGVVAGVAGLWQAGRSTPSRQEAVSSAVVASGAAMTD